MRHWLMKSEPGTFSLDDLQRLGASGTLWDGVRNYQARNFMRDDMRASDPVLFYHSSTDPEPHVAGLAEIISEAAVPDPTQFDPESPYFDPKSTPENPRWMTVRLRFVRHFPRPVNLSQIKADPTLEGILVAKKGMRLSIQPLEAAHFQRICALGESGS